MKTVKFKDLPEKVQEFLVRVLRFNKDGQGGVLTDWLHTIHEWSKATDEERLAYAEWKYPKGTKVKAYNTNTNLNDFIVEGYFVSNQPIVSCASTSSKSRTLYRLIENRWATIISEPEKEDFEMNASIKRDVEQILAEDSEPTFKAGDEVVYQGSTISKVIHVFDGMAWIKNADQNYGSLVRLSDLRKYEPDPDKVYREIAKEIMDRYIERDNKRIEQILIEALKKGKEL